MRAHTIRVPRRQEILRRSECMNGEVLAWPFLIEQMLELLHKILLAAYVVWQG